MIAIGVADAGAEDLGTDVAFSGQIQNRIFLGEHTEYLVSSPGLGDILVLSPKHVETTRGSFDRGEAVTIGWKNDVALALLDN